MKSVKMFKDLLLICAITSMTIMGCPDTEEMVGYENETVDMMFDVNVPYIDLIAYTITRHNGNNRTQLLIAIYQNRTLPIKLTVNHVEFIGDVSTGNLSIRIASMNKSYEGIYILQHNRPRKSIVTCIELMYRVRPNIPVILNIDPSGNGVTGIEDKIVTLVCRSTGGYPKPTMAWYRTSNQPAPLVTNTDQPKRDDRTYTLEYTFRAKRADDGATFVCQSSYDPPRPLNIQADTKLNLSLKPSIPMLNLNAPLRESSNNMVIANCSSAGFKPDTARLIWMLEGSTMVPVSNRKASSSGTFIVTAEYTSTISKTLNGKLLTCSVNHTSLDTPLRAERKLDVQFAPTTATLSGVSSGIVADVKNKINLTCTADISNPPSNIKWYRNNTTLERNSQIQQTSGEYNGNVTSQTLVFEAVRAMDGDEIFCEVYNVVNGDNHIRSDTITLDLRFHPIANLLDGAPVVEGQEKTFRCVIQSKPASSITWYHHEAKLSTGAKMNYTIPVVNRSHAGTYSCEAVNGFLPNGTSQTSLIVQYAPDVEVTTTNVTVNDSLTQVRCSPSGIPAVYKFSEWQHIWPGVGAVVHKTGLGTNQTLSLSQLTYEYSGIYNCSVSNGINGSLKPNAGYGVAYLQVETFPIITADGDFKVPGRLNKNTNATIAFYSNVKDNNVACFIGNIQHACSAVFIDGEVNLPLFDTTIQTTGTLAHISFSISSVDQFGDVNIRISNRIGNSERAVEVIPEGPPQTPTEESTVETRSNSVILSWVPGFHGGFNQSFVIEYSPDGQTWRQEHMVEIQGGLTLRRVNGTVSNLQSGTLYFMRLMSRNEKGNSNYTRVLNVTTDPSPDRDALTGNNLVPAIAGGIAAAVVVAVALVVFVLARRRYRKHSDNDTEQSRQSLHEANVQDDSGMEINQAYVSTDDLGVVPSSSAGSSNIYAQVNKSTKQAQSAIGDNTYAVVNKSKPKAEGTSMSHDGLYATPMKKKAGNKVQEKNKKKEKRGKRAKKDKQKGVDVYENVHELNSYGNASPNDVADDGNIYENRDDSKFPRRNLNKDGLLYADLEFANDTKGQRKLMIHGLENTTEYIQVDFTKRADPLPDSDDEETQP